ncbi:MAG TPA: hypothetical protein VND93_07035 [Myxococcales bacterium]|nr:hypothetical protein [Myxococcales bacterium]
MTLAPLLCALALGAGPASGGEAPLRGAGWINSGGVAVTAIGGGATVDVPLGATIPLPAGPTLDFELTYFQWSCTGTATCTVRSESGVFATGGVHVDLGGPGPLAGFFLSPKLQLSTLGRTFPAADTAFDGQSFGVEVGLDLGYQWRVGPLYLALVAGASFGFATHYPSGLYGLLVEWNGSSSSSAQLAPQPISWVYGINGNILRLGFTF